MKEGDNNETETKETKSQKKNNGPKVQANFLGNNDYRKEYRIDLSNPLQSDGSKKKFEIKISKITMQEETKTMVKTPTQSLEFTIEDLKSGKPPLEFKPNKQRSESKSQGWNPPVIIEVETDSKNELPNNLRGGKLEPEKIILQYNKDGKLIDFQSNNTNYRVGNFPELQKNLEKNQSTDRLKNIIENHITMENSKHEQKADISSDRTDSGKSIKSSNSTKSPKSGNETIDDFDEEKKIHKINIFKSPKLIEELNSLKQTLHKNEKESIGQQSVSESIIKQTPKRIMGNVDAKPNLGTFKDKRSGIVRK